MEGSTSTAALAMASVSATTAEEKSGNSPRWTIARRAMTRRVPRVAIADRLILAILGGNASTVQQRR